MPRIWIDADATPKKVKELLFRAAQRRRVPMTFVANQYLTVPRFPTIKIHVVPQGLDKADDYIAEQAQEGDLVITADVPLAARCVEKEAMVISPRGRLFDSNNIAASLSVRNFNEELRNAGVVTGGPSSITPKDIQSFANALDRWIQGRRSAQ